MSGRSGIPMGRLPLAVTEWTGSLLEFARTRDGVIHVRPYGSPHALCGKPVPAHVKNRTGASKGRRDIEGTIVCYACRMQHERQVGPLGDTLP